MIKVRQKYNSNVVYFKFFASEKYPNEFWYTKTDDNFGFELGKINDYIPLYKTWEEIEMKKSDCLYFKVAYYEGMINIDTPTITEKEDFGYANIKDMYANGDGVGIQVNNTKNEKHLKQMCNKISKAVYECVGKIKEEHEKR